MQVSLSREQIERIIERVNENLDPDPDKEFNAAEVARRARGK